VPAQERDLGVLRERVVELAVAFGDRPAQRLGIDEVAPGDAVNPRDEILDRVGDDEVLAVLL
jgi:hypothetical protein